MKLFAIVLAIWIIAIIIFLAGLWCGKRITEMKYESLKTDNEENKK